MLRLARRFRPALRTAFAAVAAAPLLLAAACGDSTAPDASVAGTYQLATVSGQPLPYVVQTAGRSRQEVYSGTAELRADQTFTLTVRERDTDLTTGAVVENVEAASGRYAVRGSTVTFSNTTNGDLDGEEATVSGNTLVYGPLTFRR